MRIRGIIKPTLLSVVLGATLQNMAFAQQAASKPDQVPPVPVVKELDAVKVVGSRLSSTRAEGASPVKVLGEEAIAATGAISGDELLQAIPQVGTMMFNNTDAGAGLNAARGDVGSINLRDLGSGNTLLMVNGRRMVLHPGSQTENLVPVQTSNVNSIPLYGVRRTE